MQNDTLSSKNYIHLIKCADICADHQRYSYIMLFIKLFEPHVVCEKYFCVLATDI